MLSMTEQPPFPAPLGMVWDPNKKRFFKAVPGSATAAVAHAGTQAKQERLKERQERDRRLLDGRRTPEIGYGTQTVASPPPLTLQRQPRTPWHDLQSRLPRFANSNRSQQSLAQRSLAALRHVRTAYVGCDPDGFQFCNHQVGVHALHCSDGLGALLFFMTWNKQVTLIDTSSLWQKANSFVQLHSALQPWSATKRSYQTSVQDSNPSFACSYYESNPDTPDCFAMDGKCFAYFTMRKRLHIQHLDSSRTDEVQGRAVSINPEDSFTFTIADKWLEDGIISLSIRSLSKKKHAITCIGHGKEVCVLQSWPVATSNDGRRAHGLGQYRFKSDVLSHDFSPDGTRLVVGCRNGRLSCIDTSSLEVAEVFPFAFGGRGMRKAEKSDLLPFKMDGAVTNVRFTSPDTFLAVSSHGQVVLLSVSQPDMPLMNFIGHFNAWTLNTPLAIDIAYRVFALAGQDRRVRIWSMDEAFPLSQPSDTINRHSIPINIQEHTAHDVRLCDASFVGEVTGLAFCSRHDVARLEAQQNSSFLERGIPALAVSCGRKSIAFFE